MKKKEEDKKVDSEVKEDSKVEKIEDSKIESKSNDDPQPVKNKAQLKEEPKEETKLMATEEVEPEKGLSTKDLDFIIESVVNTLTQKDNEEVLDTLEVKIKKLNEHAVIPMYKTKGAIGMDIVANDCYFDEKLDAFVYTTGWAIELPEGYGMNILPRSSNRNTDYYMPNTPALIDSDYRGEVQVTYKHRDGGQRDQPYQAGERVAQATITFCPKIEFIEVDELSETERGANGHGHTGK